MNRRTYLAGLSAGVAVLGGCLGDEDEDAPPTKPVLSIKSAFQPWEEFTRSTTSTPARTSDYDGVVEIRHEVGDTVEPTAVFVKGDGIDPLGEGFWSQQRSEPRGEIWGDEREVVEGSAIYVRASFDRRLRVVWSPQGEIARKVLHRAAGGRLTERPLSLVHGSNV